jgi:hypothetical protein
MPVLLFFVLNGVASAYDNYVHSTLETSLKANIEAVRATRESCEKSYQNLLKYKQENGLAVQGTPSPCPLQ